jgi:hypothetical protein
MHPEIPPYIYITFTAVTSIGVLMQACILLGMFIGLRRLQGRIDAVLDYVTEHALPLIASSKATMEELSPKLKTITGNLVEISETLKTESHTIKDSVDDVLVKTRAQTARVDEMVSGTLDGLTQAGAAIQHGVAVPLRQVQAILNGLKVGFETLKRSTPQPRPRPVSPPDGEVTVVEEVIVVEREPANSVRS